MRYSILISILLATLFVAYSAPAQAILIIDTDNTAVRKIAEIVKQNNCPVSIIGGQGERIYLDESLVIYYGSKTDPQKTYRQTPGAPHFTLEEFSNLECFPKSEAAEAAGYVSAPTVLPQQIGAVSPGFSCRDDQYWDEKTLKCTPLWRLHLGRNLGIVGLLLVLHLYTALALFVLARKLKTKYRWLAWIPLANVYLVVRMAGKQWWWWGLWFVWIFLFVLLLLPLRASLLIFLKEFLGLYVSKQRAWFRLLIFISFIYIVPIFIVLAIINVIVFILLWVQVVRRLGRPSWWGWIIALVPGINLVFLGRLAWGKAKLLVPVK